MKHLHSRPYVRARRSFVFAIDRLEPRVVFNTYTVTNTGDTTTGGTLRQAILDANNSLGADTIVFDATFYASPHTIVIDSAPPQINQQLTIIGPGSSLLTIQRTANGLANSRNSFNSFATVLNLSGMTVTGGAISGGGGGLSAVGVAPNVTLDDMVFTNNSATGFGGAIFMGNNGSLTIRNSLITGNSASSGGGIYFFNSGALLMENTTLKQNSATGGTSATAGGLYFDANALASPPAGYTPSTLVIRNSTFSGNTSTGIGGGIHVDTLAGTLQLQNTTLSGNTAAVSGGGLAGTSGTGSLLLQDCTITQNTANGTASTNGGGGIFRTSILNNTLTMVNTVVSGNTNTIAADIKTDAFTTLHANFCAIGSSTGFTLAADSGNNLPYLANLMLGSLASNGGTTQTHAILSGSPLLNAGSNAAVPSGLSNDQRGTGYSRIVGSAVDIGAFEVQAVGPVVQNALFYYLTPPQSLRLTFNTNVASSLANTDLVLKNLTTNQTVSSASIAVSYDTATNLATFTFPGYSNGALPDGNYRATLPAGSVKDSALNSLVADFVFDFYFLNADANRDRIVDTQDFNILAANFGGSNKLFSQGNFNYDASGLANSLDFNVLTSHYGVRIAPAAAVLMSIASPFGVLPTIDQPTLDIIADF